MNVYTFLLRPCSYFDLFHTERDERRTCSGHLFVCVVPVTLLTVLLGAWGCFSLPPLSVLFYRSRVFNPWEAAGMNRCRGWKCAGRQSYRGVQFTVSYIAAIVFLSASISSYVTCGKDVKFCCFVWVVGHKRFSCLMLLLLKGERWASVVPVRPPQITAMFLCLMGCFFFFIYLLNLLYPKPKHRCWVNRPTFSPILLSVLKICPRLAFVLHTFGSSASKTICKKQPLDSKEGFKRVFK